jgi:hypothetical protein
VLGAVVALPAVAACGLRLAALRAETEPPPLRRRAVALLAASVALADLVALVLLAR